MWYVDHFVFGPSVLLKIIHRNSCTSFCTGFDKNQAFTAVFIARPVPTQITVYQHFLIPGVCCLGFAVRTNSDRTDIATSSVSERLEYMRRNKYYGSHLLLRI